MNTFKVYVSDYDFPDLQIEKSILEPIGAEVIGLQCKTGEELAELAHDADAIIQQYAKITRQTIESLNGCKVIARYGIGVDIVDVEAALARGITVTNVPEYCIEEVADHTVAMALCLIRSIPSYNKAVREGRWHWSDWYAPIPRLRGMKFGIIGFGRIAQNLSRKLNVFGIEMMVYDPYVSDSYIGTFGVSKTDLPTLLQASQVVVVLCPYTPATHHLIDEQALQSMRSDAYLVNCSRGKVVDNQALYRALVEGTIVAAALDDTEEEPAKQKDWSPKGNRLFELDRCIITPHAAYVSETALLEARRVAAENVRAVLTGQKPLNPVRPAAAVNG